LKRHVAVAHGEERPFACSDCEKKYAVKKTLQAHVKRVHQK
jgi:hypothetical protein